MRSRFDRIGALLAFLGMLLVPQAAVAAGQTLGAAALASDAAARATALSAPIIGATPNPIDFGDVTVGNLATRAVTVTNSGNQPLTLSSALLSNPRFTSSFTDARVIPAGGNYSFFVFYTPLATMLDTGLLTLVSDAQNGDLAIPVSGIGVSSGAPDLGAGRVLIAPTGESAGDQFGLSTASAGDLNGDGFGDVIVGAWTNDAGGPDAGRAYVYFGGIHPDLSPDLVLEGERAGDNFGTSVASAGDVNGDGYPDIIVGAYANDDGGTDAGRAYVYFGGPAMDAFPDRVFTGAAAGDHFGISVCAAGDVNGDGYGDVAVGAFLNDAGGKDAGRVYVYFGGPTADNVADWVLTGAAAGDHFGWSTSSAGDFDADGYGDLFVGAPDNDAGGANAGRGYLFFGGVAPDPTPDLLLTGEAAGDRFGIRVACASDVNGDHYPDVIAGADSSSVGGVYAGRVYVFYGGPTADAIPDLTLTGNAPQSGFGAYVASAGDVNADGYSDVLVGAWLNSEVQPFAGRAYLYYGGPGADAVPDAVFTGEHAGDRLGDCVASAGDVDGDGRDDLLLGAYFNDAAGGEAGRAYVVSLQLQRAPVVIAPSSVSGVTGAPISFQVNAADPDGGTIQSLTAAPLPTGASFDVSPSNMIGTFAWTPGALQIGTYSVTFTASNGVTGFTTTTIVVEFGGHAPVVIAPASVLGAEGVPISFAVHASDADGDHVTLGAFNRPVGSIFIDNGDNTGLFTWTPGFGQSGSYSVSFTGRDGGGAEAAPAVVSITVDNVNRSPSASPGGPYEGVVNVPISFVGTASSDPDGDALSYHWNFGDSASGTGPTPLHAYASGGVFTVTLTVDDGSSSAFGSTTAAVQDVFPALAFLEGGNRTTRLNSGKAATCVQVEPVDRSYLNTSVQPASIVMISPGTGIVDRISAIADKTTIGGDKNQNGVGEITVCFAKPDLRNLFSALSGGRHTVAVTIEGALSTGGRFRTTLEMDVVASGNSLAASVSPNPLNPVGTLTFRTIAAGAVRISMFDAAGRLVRTILSEPFLAAGYHDATIDGRRDDGARLASGVYFYRVDTAEGSAVGRIVVLK